MAAACYETPLDMAFNHSRSGSDTSSSGSSYQLILDHVLTYPGSYEIPLRTMYTLNCAPRAQPLNSRSITPTSSSAGSSPVTGQFAWQETSTQAFTESLMAQISQIPNQPSSLPPSFVTSFLNRCFPANLVQVDFPQALTGLDYLKDLEMRRRREVAAAMSRLDIDRSATGQNLEALSEQYPGVSQWVKNIEEKERKIESHYTQLYVALRRWILINELSLLPFNKHNCIAMLNTLYPPVIPQPPTSKLTPAVLKLQRDGFFKYITSVEKSGPRMLNTVMQQGKLPNDDNGWVAVTRILGMYLQLANSMISECADISQLEDVSPRKTKSVRPPRTKVDSGISIGESARRPSTTASSTADPSSPTEPTRPKTPSHKSSTALEKLARGLKTIGRSRTDVTEMLPQLPSASPPLKTRSLRAMRSLGALSDRARSTTSLASHMTEQTPAFDATEMRLQRQKYEANAAAHEDSGRQLSREV